ncbi:probable caffeoyl-CoA O-methyltransferase At4g26220 [Dioscorea cayenensis subsp. rotundata]|uniref:Probable caffeoyl-CoA O-methyltransferase At4g26220 n=1 Tax=Dioscorea cayennensis subsp. rotundata TaxID=55577 RepID=A0AB40C5J7_DIOCR|nr:probable caffeoyl-CoA O-methyltransferase At4g26220 [Dioscorea cayenensis subsp. rotundata]
MRGIASFQRFTSPRALLFRPPSPPPPYHHSPSKPYSPLLAQSLLPSITRFRSLQTDASPVIVSEDDSFGKKQVISLTPQLYDYILSNVREPPILRELREETATLKGSQMLVSPDQAQLLAMLVQILGANRCIEVGVFTGYSSLAVALVLPESGYLVACEKDAKCLEIAKKYYELAAVAHKVDVKQALAADTLQSLLDKGEGCSYDFAFLDADKRKYDEYFEYLFQLVRVGGVIVIDNVLWHGKVANPNETDKKTNSLRKFNRKIFKDERISTSVVPVGDGMTICRKK